EAAAHLGHAFPDGVCFVRLAAIRDPSLVLPSIPSALAIDVSGPEPPTSQLAAALGDRAALIVLDNVEQVVAAAPELADLVAACSRLALLVTSRAPLRVAGERELPVPPLPVPDGGAITRQRAAGYAAVRLFVERVQAITPGFALDEGNAAEVVAICRQLDGPP